MKKSLITTPRRLLLATLLTGAATTHAALPDSTLLLLRHADADRTANLRMGSLNPVSLRHHAVKDYGYGAVGYSWTHGGYHAPDASGHADAIDVRLDGRRRLGAFDVAGYIAYLNSTERHRSWNSTLFLPADNPFVLCDSVAGETSTESFRLGVAAAWNGGGRLTAALRADMLTGSMADQTDPRPKTDATWIHLAPGAELTLTPALSLGLALSADIYRANTSHVVINTMETHRFFLMKGVGDFQRQSSADIGSYPREYKGETFGGALTLVYEPQGKRWRNFLELRAAAGGEDAVDGGTHFTYRGGDYARRRFSLNERAQIVGSRATHDVTLEASYATGEGTWYDQRRLVDTEHGNITYYETLSKDLIYKSADMAAGIGWRATLPGRGLPRWTFTASARVERSERRHFAAETTRQELTRAALRAGVERSVALRRWALTARLAGACVLPLGERTYGSALADLETEYAAPFFEYRSAREAGVSGSLEALVPLRSSGLGLRAFADASGRFFLGNGTWSDRYDGTSQLNIRAGVGLAF